MAALTGGCLPTDIWLKWEKQGKFTFLKKLKKATAEENQEHVSRLVYDLLSNGIQGTLKKDNLGATISEMLSLNEEIPSIVLDALYALDSEISEDDEEQRQSLYNIVKELEKFLPEALLKERLEIETLINVGTLKNKNFRTKFIRIKTKLYYKQKKFNLLREESEGYAKLITELNQEDTDSFTSANIWEATKSLIGCFNLDPNRVVDLILEALEIRPECADVFIEVLKNFADVQSVICEILGFKLVHYYRSKGHTPSSLYILAALLLQREIIDIDHLYPWLMPLDSVIEKDWDVSMNRHKEAVKKIQSLMINKEKDELEPEVESPREKYMRNQKLGLCEALLREGAWPLAKNIINRLPNRCALTQPPISQALCALIHATIEPVYASYGGLPAKIKRKPVAPLSSPFSPPRVASLPDLRNDVIPMITTLGSSMHVDPLLIYKIIRICRAAMERMPGGEVKERPEEDSLYLDIMTLLDSAILPSLSYLENNCSIAEEAWTLLKCFPYHRRYCLYSRWKNDAINDDAILIHKNAEALKLLKNLMKRVSKENIKPIGRLLGKVTHACPGVLFDYVLIQLQTFENLISPVVDSLKFLTSLSYDVLGFCIVDTLAKASLDKSRAKFDGSTISNWLQALASFCGAAFKKYNIELTGLLQFVANQLKDKNSLDLLIVREVVVKMAGIEAMEEMTNEQINALSGGELLKGEAGYYCQVRNTKKSSQRLKEALNEYDLGPSLCLLMAQQRHGVVYKDDQDTHLKHVARLYDQCQDTLVQFGTFLGSSLTVDEYVSKFPSVHAMLSEYHINGDVAFFLARPTLNHAINQKYESLRKADANVKKLTMTAKLAKYTEAVNCVVSPLVESVRLLHPPRVWEEISPQFFVTFWSLSMYDLMVPADAYTREINKLKKLGLQTLESKELPANKMKKEAERYNVLVDKLTEEQKKQSEHVEKVMARLKQEKSKWFVSKSQRMLKNESIVYFLQMCVFPRCLFTANDAIFCAKFITTMHSLRTENFPTVICLDRMFCDISYTVTMCTENEAHRYGRFLCSVLEVVLRWHSKLEIFNEECMNTVGFETTFKVNKEGGSQSNSQITYEPYRDLCHKWYYKMTRATMLCLESKDFNQIRNALIVLIKVLPHFPKLARLAGILSKRIEKIREEEKTKRPDLYTLATSYFGLLKAKSVEFVRESDFHIVTPPPKPKEQPKEVKPEKEANDVVVVVDDERRQDKKDKDGKEKEKAEKRSDSSKGKPADSPRESRDREKERSEREKEKEREKKEAHRERVRERREERHANKDDRTYKEDRYKSSSRGEPYGKEDRYSGGSGDADRGGGGGYYPASPSYSPLSPQFIPRSPNYKPSSPRYTPHSPSFEYYKKSPPAYNYPDDQHNLSEVSNSPTHSLDNVEPDRDTKRRKVESSSSKMHRSPDWAEPVSSSTADKPEKKDRSSRSKDKAPRKERKSTRKRERRPEEGSPPPEGPKMRKDEEPGPKSQNGNSDLLNPESLHGSKQRVYDARDKTPVYGEDGRRERDRERERSRDKPLREKQRTEGAKRR